MVTFCNQWKSGRKVGLLVIVAVALGAFGVPGLPPVGVRIAAAASPCGTTGTLDPGTVTCTYTTVTAGDSFTVPAGWTQARFDVFGAAGQTVMTANFTASGGAGGEAAAIFNVNPGDVYQIVVGAVGGGAAASDGAGNGGAASDVRSGLCATGASCSLANRIVVGGGGGGAGSGQLYGGTGGAGGGNAGDPGGSPGGSSPTPGGGGTSSAGGAGGLGYVNGSAGTLGYGGHGGHLFGGGGGDGYYGGGGGGGNPLAGGVPTYGLGGGGGSGYVSPSAAFASYATGVRAGAGKVVISRVAFATLSSSANPSTYGNPVTFTAQLTPSSASGTVQFAIDGLNVGAPVTVSGGIATSSPLSTMGAGQHTVRAIFTGTDNYTRPTAMLTPNQKVDPAILTVTPNNQSMTSGALDPAFTASITGFRNGDTSGVVTSQPSCGVTGTHTAVGTYVISCSGGAAANYTFDDSANATLTVTPPAFLKVTPANQTKAYGSPDPVFAYSITGFQSGDTPAVVTLQPTCGVAGPHFALGTYTISCSGGAAGSKYTFDDTATATLTVTPAVLSVRPNNRTKVYGDPDPAFTFSVTGFANGDTASVFTSQPICGVAGPHVIAIAYTITCSGGAAGSNYTVDTAATATLTIFPVVLKVTPANATKVYGSPYPDLGYPFTVTGFINGDNASLIMGLACLLDPGSMGGPVGTYTIFCMGGGATNYRFDTSATATLTVTPAVLVVTPANQTKLPGAPDPPFGFSISGFQYGQTAAVLMSQPNCGVAAPHTAAGPYTITCSGGLAQNYTFDTTATATLTVSRPVLVVTPANQTRVYGASDPTFGYSITGFRSGDTAAVVTIQPSCDVAGAHAAVGTYAITCSGGAAGTYDFDETATATLTVTRAALKVMPANQTQVYGAPDTTFGFTITGFRNGDTASVVTTQPSCGVAASHTLVGTYVINCTGGTAGPNYDLEETSTASLSVLRAILRVTPANQTKVYGAPDPTFGFTITGFRNGDTASVVTTEPSCGVAASHTGVGSYVINCTGGTAGPNYTLDETPLATLTLSKASTATALASSLTPSLVGQAVTLTATVRPVAPGAGSPTGAVDFRDGGRLIPSCASTPLSAAGQATCRVTYAAGGSHTVTAAYGGDASFTNSDSSATPLVQVVTYGIKLLYDPTEGIHIGSRVQIRVALVDAGGHNLSSGVIVLTVAGIDPNPGRPSPGGNFTFYSNHDEERGQFRGDDEGASAGYRYKLMTKGFKPGSYNLLFTAGADPTVHHAPFLLVGDDSDGESDN